MVADYDTGSRYRVHSRGGVQMARRIDGIDYRRMVSMPIRDELQDGKIVFCVDVYGVEPSDLCLIPGGSRPMHRAVERMGLDPMRYRAHIWDVPINGINRRRKTDPGGTGYETMGGDPPRPGDAGTSEGT